MNQRNETINECVTRLKELRSHTEPHINHPDGSRNDSAMAMYSAYTLAALALRSMKDREPNEEAEPMAEIRTIYLTDQNLAELIDQLDVVNEATSRKLRRLILRQWVAQCNEPKASLVSDAFQADA